MCLKIRSINELQNRCSISKSNIKQIIPEIVGGVDTEYVFDFDKHVGLRLAYVPRDYLRYILKKKFGEIELDYGKLFLELEWYLRNLLCYQILIKG